MFPWFCFFETMIGNYCFSGNKIQSKLHKQTVCDISTRRGFFPLTQFKWHFPKEARKGRHGVFYSPRYIFFDPDYILVSSDSELVQKYYIAPRLHLCKVQVHSRRFCSFSPRHHPNAFSWQIRPISWAVIYQQYRDTCLFTGTPMLLLGRLRWLG